MPVRRSTVVTLTIACLLGGTVAWAAPEALAGSSQASGTQQTHPSVRPKVGHRHSTFELRFTLAQAPGRIGLLETDYRTVVSPRAHASASCSPTQPAPVVSGNQGDTIQIPLSPPANGWCNGRYVVTVFLQRTQVCGPPVALAPHLVCPVTANLEPAFPTTQVDTGGTHFTVR